MDTANLGTTNVMLGIVAAASALEALALIGLAICGVILYRRVTSILTDVEQQMQPVRAKVDAILETVHSVAARVDQRTERVDQAITGTMERVDETAERVRSSMREKVMQAVGVVQGIRAVLISLFTTRP